MRQTDDILEGLNDEQRQAVQHVEGPLLIVAGAGSGKTRVITRRVAYLLGIGVSPTSILAITFTNKAAGEMKSRISSALPRPIRDFGRLDQPWPIICTFHSLGLRILRHYAGPAGLDPNFSVYDSSDQEKLIKQALGAAELERGEYAPGAVHHAISRAKNRLVDHEAFAAAARGQYDRDIARIYKHYQRLLKSNNALDFDDLLMRTAELFRSQREVLEELQGRFEYIMIDEYQDTNHAQYIVAHALAQKHRNMAVVGDPDQSIYAWRGADIQNILDFEKDYSDAKIVKLERNYRSTQTILDIASKLISFNRQRKKKELWTEEKGGTQARLLICADERDEAVAVVGEFKRLKAEGFGWNQMAVFYRINALSRVVEDALRRSAIPYRVARGVDFYHRKEIKDVLAYLKTIANPADELSLARIVNVPARGISDATVKQMQVVALDRGWTLHETLLHIEEVPGVSSRAANSVRQFIGLIHRWRQLAAKLAADPEARIGENAGRVAGLIADVVSTSGLEAYLRKSGAPEMEELANVNELISSAVQYDQEHPESTLTDYLAQVSLVSDVDMLEEAGGAVTLMTLHSAKGLEFPVVSMIAMEDGALPHARVRDEPAQMEEERRLCFVGITRAQQRLILSCARRRTIRGLTETVRPSPFLREMPSEAVERIERPAFGSRWEDDDAMDDVDDDFGAPTNRTQFRKGQSVRHPQFGLGRIVEMGDMGKQTRLIVEFQRAGRKTLILEYARLEAVG